MSKNCSHVVCLIPKHYPELIFGKIYKATEDEQGKEENWIRVWSETEDLLFPRKWFKTIELSREIEEALETV